MKLWTSGPAKPQRNMEIIRMLHEGSTMAEASRKFGLSYARIKQIRNYYRCHGDGTYKC